MALAAYRNILRATRLAFQGDLAILSAARAKARDDFDASRNLQPNSEDAQKQVAHANEVAKILKENVVQGQANDDGRYKLRIHEHTERGDNETIKQTKGNNSLAGVKCCSS
ncbi:Mitochondrial zinc maintenance protein 1, mitochondrial [Botryosphaeria dothidea]|uniref:Mitochondrial zinc maintenance protein 1, mitochondrial n=1 Tax=Botryosphaeria dothidea TaxID=55169 RepID=A0A8H4N293_9PEZI|nr:Mitochondrial zinc maintenance protein 1, mitochondrial [Botryosphaeria dothidea]